MTLTLTFSEAMTVAGGTPTLTLNDGGSATYTGGSGTSALTFSYTVAAGQNTSSLAATTVNLNGATITNGAGTAANLSLTGLTQAGPQIDTTAPVISAIGETPSSGDLDASKTVTYTLTMSGAVTVNTAGGSPTLSLNDGGTATYVSGSGSSALVFSYTVLAGQNTPDLQVSAVNLNGSTIDDGAGNAANLSISGLTQGSPQIDTTAPTVSSVTATAGDYDAGKALTLTLAMSEAVNVTGTPTLALSDGGTASYVSGTGTSTLVFSYTVAAGQNTTTLQVTGVSGTITDLAGNALSSTGLPETVSGVIIDTTTPAIASVVESPSSGDITAGNSVTLTLDMSEAVTVNTSGGSPTLTLNDGGIATYVSGSGSSTLVFSYTVASGQSTAALAATAVNLNGATIKDGTGTTANLSLTGLSQTGPEIGIPPPAINSITESPSSGDLDAGKTVTLTLGMTETVTVNTAGGTPTLTLNDGGTATYVSGSGSSALVFSYTVGASDSNVASLSATTVNLNGATIENGSGEAATPSLTGLTQSGPQIDTTTPVISSIADSPSSGDLTAGNSVTLALDMSEVVTVNTTGGTPTLTLNDGGTATYVSGSGSSTLVFSYTVASGQSTAALAATAVNLNGATIADGAGNTANLSLTGLTQSGPQINIVAPAAPIIANDIIYSNSTVSLSGTAQAGSTVTVYDGSTALGTTTASAGGAWSFLTGTLSSGTNSFTATAAVPGAVSTASAPLSVTIGSTSKPVVSSIVESPSSGDLAAGSVVTLTLNLSEPVTVTTTGGTPTLLLNDGATATYVSGSGSSALTFSYTVAAGQNTSDLTVSAVSLNGGTIKNSSGRSATLTLSGVTQSGPQIDTTTPTVTSVVDSPSSGDLAAGATVTLTLDMNEVVTVNTAGGTPTLTLNDGGTATYTSGSGSSALVFSYTVAAGQTTTALAASAVKLNGATIQDGAGNAANLSLTGLTQTGPQIDAAPPGINTITESPSSGDLDAGKTVTLTLAMSNVVTVNTSGGTPTLTLNDGGTATYTSGSGTSALTFSYTVGGRAEHGGAGGNRGQPQRRDHRRRRRQCRHPIADRPGADRPADRHHGAGHRTSITESPSSGDLDAGKTVTLTLDTSEVVTVNTSGGRPTLTLNDGGTATYVSGSGTSALVFSYTVAAGQNTAALAATSAQSQRRND